MSVPTVPRPRPIDHAHQRFRDVLAADVDDREHPHQDEAEHLGRAELEAELGEGGGGEGEADRAEDAGEEGADGRKAEGRSRFPLLGELVTFERRDDRRGLPGDVDEDRGGGAAVHRPVVEGGQHDHRGCRVHAEGDRQDDGHRRRGAEAGEDPDHRSEKGAQGGHREIVRGEAGREPAH